MTSGLSPALRRDIERWFVARGVPQLVEDYSSEPAMDARASPLIVVWLVYGTVRDWGTRPEWPVLWNAAGVAATIAWGVLLWAVVGRIRRRGDRPGPRKFDPIDIATMGFLPGVPAAVIDASARELITAPLNALLGIGLIYVVIGMGMIEIGAWAVRRLEEEAGRIAGLVARMLPLLLILVVFLLFATEMWHVAHSLNGVELAAALLLVFVVALLLLVLTFRNELTRLEQRIDTEGVLADAAESPASRLVDPQRPPTLPARPLTWLQRTNLAALVVIPQVLHAVAVAVVVTAFLVAFAVIVLPEAVQVAWVGEPVNALVRLALFDEGRTISAELLVVCALLGEIVGLYYVGLSISDPTFRSEQFDPAIGEVRRLLATRAVYLAAMDDSPAH